MLLSIGRVLATVVTHQDAVSRYVSVYNNIISIDIIRLTSVLFEECLHTTIWSRALSLLNFLLPFYRTLVEQQDKGTTRLRAVWFC